MEFLWNVTLSITTDKRVRPPCVGSSESMIWVDTVELTISFQTSDFDTWVQVIDHFLIAGQVNVTTSI